MTAPPLAERISGDTSIGHGLAYCAAVEDALGCSSRRAALALRGVLLELERLYNHIADLGALANDVGYGIANAHALRIRETLLRLNAEVTGHRLLRGALAPGRRRRQACPTPIGSRAIAADVEELAEHTLGHAVVRDRFAGTAVLTAESAREIGCLGYVARASGIGVDARTDHPTAPVTVTPSSTTPVTCSPATSPARASSPSPSASSASCSNTSKGSRSTSTGRRTPSRRDPRRGIGIVEGWRGTIATRVEIDRNAVLTRVKPVDPSWFNWPALPVALAETIVPGLPLVNKSFNQSYAGNDL